MIREAYGAVRGTHRAKKPVTAQSQGAASVKIRSTELLIIQVLPTCLAPFTTRFTLLGTIFYKVLTFIHPIF